MRVQTEEWRRFIPGVRMYKGKKTYFYNGEKLWEGNNADGHPLIHDYEERESWELIIVLPGVEVIPDWAFLECEKIEAVIMNDSVKRVELCAFAQCKKLKNVRLSTNIEIIGESAFFNLHSAIMSRDSLNLNVVEDTELIKRPPFENLGLDTEFRIRNTEIWIRNINRHIDYELHRACSSFNPLENILVGILKRKGLKAFRKENSIGITPLQYLEANPHADVDQHKLIKQYIKEMTGEAKPEMIGEVNSDMSSEDSLEVVGMANLEEASQYVHIGAQRTRSLHPFIAELIGD